MLALMAYAATSEQNLISVDTRWIVAVLVVLAFVLVLRDEKWAVPLGAAVGVGGLLIIFFATF